MRIFQLLLLTALGTGTALAQLPGSTGNIGGLLGVSVPKGEFADTWGKNTFTFGGQLAFPMGVLPLQAGFAFGYGIMGKETRTVPVDQEHLAATEGQLAVKAKVLSYHPLLRFSPLRGKVRPYVDGMIGMRQFTTQSTLTVDGLEDPLTRERNANDFVFSTGWAGGIMVGLGSIGYFEARVERFNSGKANYVDPASISIDDNGTVGFNTRSSNTDVMNFLVGIGFRF